MKLSREFVRDGEAVAVQVERVEGDRFRVRVGDQVYDYDARAMPDGGVRLQQLGEGGKGGKGGVAYGAGSQQSYMVRVDGRTHALEAPQRFEDRAHAGPFASLPGEIGRIARRKEPHFAGKSVD